MGVSASVPQGAGPPLEFVMDVTPGQSPVDLTTVTDAVFVVRNPHGANTVWPTTLSNQTSNTLRLTHVYDPNDVAQVGQASVYAKLTVPGGTLITSSVQLAIVNPFT